MSERYEHEVGEWGDADGMLSCVYCDAAEGTKGECPVRLRQALDAALYAIDDAADEIERGHQNDALGILRRALTAPSESKKS